MLLLGGGGSGDGGCFCVVNFTIRVDDASPTYREEGLIPHDAGFERGDKSLPTRMSMLDNRNVSNSRLIPFGGVLLERTTGWNEVNELLPVVIGYVMREFVDNSQRPLSFPVRLRVGFVFTTVIPRIRLRAIKEGSVEMEGILAYAHSGDSGISGACADELQGKAVRWSMFPSEEFYEPSSDES